MFERRSEDELRTRLRQQAAVAELGQHALAGMDLQALLDEAVSAVSRELGAPRVGVLELQPGGRTLIVQAGVGYLDGVVGRHLEVASGSSQSAYTLREQKPVITPDLGSETRFEPAEELIAAGGRSTASVVIAGHGRSFGVLAASSRRREDYSADDIAFLQGIANTLGAAYDHRRVNEGLEREQRQLEQALARASESELRFREVADSAPVFIWTTDSEGLVTFINRSWLEFTGTTLAEELGDTWTLGVHPDDEELVQASWRDALRRQVQWEQDYRLRRHDGEYRWIVDRGQPRFADGVFVGYVGTAVDIHERRQIEQRLREVSERDHDIAETLQRSLLPASLPHIEGVEMAARYIPASKGTAVGGDWYDALELESGSVALIVGDVVGHGLRAAATMGQLRNAFRAYALVESSPAEILARMNRLLAVGQEEVMATALCLLLNRDTGRVTYASAGHPPALVIAPEGPSFLEGGRAVPLGTADPATFREAEATVTPTSTLLLYTDGLVERRDTPLDHRLAQLAAAASVAGGAAVAEGELAELCDEILNGVMGGGKPPDDVAVLAVRPMPVRADRLKLTLSAEPETLSLLRRRLNRFLNAAGATENERYEIVLTVSEAASNAIEHAYGPGDAAFEVEAERNGSEIVVEVRDRGAWRDPRGEERGRGLRIMHGLMDHLELTPGPAGTTVRMRRTLGG